MVSVTVRTALFNAYAASAAVISVTVGGDNQLAFNPKNVQASPGDIVQFTFLDHNHTVTSGSFFNGCQPSTPLLFNSNFVLVAANAGPDTYPTFDVQITNTAPIAVYCAQAQHCQSGMVMTINGATAVSSQYVDLIRSILIPFRDLDHWPHINELLLRLRLTLLLLAAE
jgi:plastocyanin